MNTEINPHEQGNQCKKVVYQGGASDTLYGLGFIGALVYYWRSSTTFQQGAVGFFKAIFWPAILVYEVLKLLKL